MNCRSRTDMFSPYPYQDAGQLLQQVHCQRQGDKSFWTVLWVVLDDFQWTQFTQLQCTVQATMMSTEMLGNEEKSPSNRFKGLEGEHHFWTKPHGYDGTSYCNKCVCLA